MLYFFLFAALAHADCFRPNGTDRNDGISPPSYVSCSTTTQFSMCCRTASGDECRNDGLCLKNGQLWRESCTDPTWKSEACIKLCVSDTRESLVEQVKFILTPK